ncbi:MAG: non-homologous end-joining DNA ligase [Xanthobacteraceae bacterium]
MTAKSKSRAARPPRPAAPSNRISLTHPDRIYWEDAGVTKQGLADYYTMVWDWISPHIVRRPLSLLRCPEGAAAECFFQKHASAGMNKDRLHLVREPDGSELISIDDLDGLISLVQAGVLEIHTRGTTIDSLETCDRVVFDLDPGPGTGWEDIIRAAREVHRRLSDLNLVAFLKTSGGKGLHVVLPVRPTPWNEAKDFARATAEGMARDEPERYTANLKKDARRNRIFVDYLRNTREATAVAPYSTRARPGAPVSTPVTWDELHSVSAAGLYTVLNLQQRLTRLLKDPWAGIDKLGQHLPSNKPRQG